VKICSLTASCVSNKHGGGIDLGFELLGPLDDMLPNG